VKHRILTGIILTVIGGGVYLTGHHLDYLRYSGDITEELMYFPSGRMLQLVSPGFETAMSDLLWLRGIQYYGQHRRSDREYLLAEHIFSTITDFDPLFIGAYRFGAFVLAQDAGRPMAGIELLRKGIRNNHERWELPFDLGFLYFVILKDHAKAAHYFKFASTFPNAPDITKRFTAFAYRKAGKEEIALSLWQQIYQSSENKVMKETALNAIRNITLEKTANQLTQLATRFHDEYGRYPEGLDELVRAGFINSLPRDPFGGDYYFDRDLTKVLSKTRVETEAQRAAEFLGRRIKTYHARYGRYPDSLGVLVEEGLIANVPSPEGVTLLYDPATGMISERFSWESNQ